MGPSSPHSTVLTLAEAMVVEFRRRTLLPLDDVMGCVGLTRFGGHPEAFTRGVHYAQKSPTLFS